MSTARQERRDDSWRRREALYDRFEQAWSMCGGPRIEDHLPPEGSPDRAEVLRELIRIDLERRWAGGQAAAIEEYVARFPELASADGPPSSLIVAEIQVRRERGRAPDSEELKARFPGRFEQILRDSVARAATLPSLPDEPAAGPGTKLGRYEVRELLGRGGFAVVYRAWDAELGREVAIKVPRPDLLGDPELRTRVLREARSAARLRHPAIVPLHEVGQDGATTWLVYEFVAGPTLAQLLRESRPAPQQAARWVAALAEALDYAHQSGIIHRDVKPANVLMRGGVEPVLTDFGLALQAESATTLTRQGDVLGTPAYMSPEQASGRSHQVDARSDVYSVGVLLYELLAGRVPFSAKSMAVMHQIIHDEPAAPRSIRNNVPVDLETICLKAMAKEPGRRYASAGALAEDLHRYLNHQPIRARRIGPLGKTARWCRRNPALAATLGVAAVIVLAVAGVSYGRILAERDLFRGERDRANQHLYQSMLSDTKAQLLARDTGWWWKATDNIRAAASLDVPNRDMQELRDLAIETMGTSFLSLRQHASWEGDPTSVTCVALGPGDRLAATGGRDGNVRLWEIPDGKPRAVLAGHQTAVSGIAYHPGGRYLAAAAQDGTLGIWDLQSLSAGDTAATPVLTVKHRLSWPADKVAAVAFSPDGNLFAAGTAGGDIYIMPAHDLDAKPAPARPIRVNSAVTCLDFAPDSRTLASGDAGYMIRLWDMSSRKQVQVWNTAFTPACVHFQPGGGSIAWGGVENFGYGFRDLRTGVMSMHVRVHASRVNQVVFTDILGYYSASSDGTILISGHQNSNRFDAAVARTPGVGVNGMAVTRRDGWVVAAHADGRVRVWERVNLPQRGFVWSNSQSVAFLGKSRRLVDDRRLYRSPIQNYGDLLAYETYVAALAAHPTEPRVAYCGNRGGTMIGDGAAEREIAAEPMVRLASDSAGRLLAGATKSGHVQLWDWRTGESARTLDPKIGAINDLSWSAGNRYLAAAGERGVFVWDANDSWKGRRLSDEPAAAVALGTDLAAVAATDNAVEIRALPSGEMRQVLRGHTGTVSAVRFFADGKRVASLGQGDAVRLWDAASGKQLAVLEGPQKMPGRTLSLDPRGRYLAAGGVWIFDLQTRNILGGVLYSTADSLCEFVGDGSGFVCAGADGSVRRCSVATIEKTMAAARGPGNVQTTINFVVFTPDETLVRGGNSDRAWAVAASPDGRWFACGCHDGTVHLWDAATLKKVRVFSGHSGLVWSVAFSADSKYLASGALEIKVWDVAAGTEARHFEGHTRLVRGLAFHPTQPLLASAASDSTVRLWDVGAGKALGILHQFPRDVMGIAFRPDGRGLAAACVDRNVAVWNLPEALTLPQAPTRMLSGHMSAVWAVAFHPEGRYLASGSNPGTIILWDGQSFERVATLKAGTGEIRSLSFSSDGELLAGGAYVAATIIWDLPTLRRSLHELGLDW